MARRVGAAGDGAAGLLVGGEGQDRPSLIWEIWDMLKLTVPIFVSMSSFVVMKATDSSLLGHSGTHYLEAVALSDLWTSSTGVFIQSRAVGMFCSQAYGAGNKELVGVWIQISYLVLFSVCLLVAAAWCATGTVLRAVGKDEDLSSDANYFAVVLMLCLPVRIAFSQLSMFFSAQKIMRPGVVCATTGMLLNLVLGLSLVLGIGVPGWKGLGFHACPWVTTCVEYVQFFILIFIFCYCKQLHQDCWPGWKKSHITRERLSRYLQQYVPQTLSGASDWWRVAAIGAIASSLGDINLAVWNTGYRICWMVLVFNGSLAAAMGIKSGQALGSGRGDQARRHALVGVIVCTSLVTALSLLVVLMPRQCGMIFSDDPAVLDLFEESRWAFAAFVGFMNLSVVLEKVPIMAGRSRTAFWLGVVGSWVGQVPGAYLCTTYWRDDLVGLYTGSAAGYALLCVLLAASSARLDWDQLAEEAAVRSEQANAGGAAPAGGKPAASESRGQA